MAEDDPNLETYWRLIDAYRRQDVAEIQRCFVPDVVLRAKGHSFLSGTYEGLGAVLAYIAGSARTFIAGTAAIESAKATDEGVEAIVTGDIALSDGGTVTARIRQVHRLTADGRIDEIYVESADDQDELDRLFALADPRRNVRPRPET